MSGFLVDLSLKSPEIKAVFKDNLNISLIPFFPGINLDTLENHNTNLLDANKWKFCKRFITTSSSRNTP